MIVCVCHRVSDHAIDRAVRSGCSSFAQLQDELRVSTQCGTCADCACEAFAAACVRHGVHAGQAQMLTAVE
jgi:bacterioferritin-associated ferredoxin